MYYVTKTASNGQNLLWSKTNWWTPFLHEARGYATEGRAKSLLKNKVQDSEAEVILIG